MEQVATWAGPVRWSLTGGGGFFVVSTVEGPQALWPQRGGTDVIWLKFLRDRTDAAWRMGWGWGKNGRRVETGG